MNFKQAMIKPWKSYFDIKGRSSRKECWAFFISIYVVVAMFLWLPYFVSYIEMLEPFGGLITAISLLLACIISLASIIPYITLQVRRLHDLDMSGWWFILFCVLPILFVPLWCIKGNRGVNRFGDAP